MVAEDAPPHNSGPEVQDRTPCERLGDGGVKMRFVHPLAVAVGKGGSNNPVMAAVGIVFMTTVLVVVLIAMWRWWRG